MLSHVSRFWLSVTSWNLCIPAGSSSAGFSRQEYWSVLPCLPPGDLPDTVTSPALAGGFFTTSATWEDQWGSQCSWNTLFLYFSCYSYPFHLQVSFSFLLTTLLTYEPGQGVLAPDLVQFSSVQLSRSVVSNSLQPHGRKQTRPPCPSPTPRIYSNSRPLSQWCHLTISFSVSPSPSTFNLSQHQGLF